MFEDAQGTSRQGRYLYGNYRCRMIFVRSSFALSRQMEEIVVSVVLIGAMLGAIACGTRKKIMQWEKCLRY
jgi:hypothetical protein